MVAHIVLLILVILSCSAVLPLRNKPAVTSKEMGALSRVSLKFACFIAYLTTCTLLIWLALQALDGIRGVSLVGGGVDTQKIHTRWRKVIDLDPMVILAWRHCSECKAPAQGDRTAATDLESALQRDIREIASSNRWPSNAETQSLQGAAIPSWFRETVESSLSVAISEKEPVREVFAIAVGGDKSEAWNPATEILRSRNVAPYIDDLQKASAGGLRLETIFGARNSGSRITAWGVVSGNGTELRIGIFVRQTENAKLQPVLSSPCVVTVAGDSSTSRLVGPTTLSCELPHSQQVSGSLWIGDQTGQIVVMARDVGRNESLTIDVNDTWFDIISHLNSPDFKSLQEDLAEMDLVAPKAVRASAQPVPSNGLYLSNANGIVSLGPNRASAEVVTATSSVEKITSGPPELIIEDRCTSSINGLSWIGIYPTVRLQLKDSSSVGALTVRTASNSLSYSQQSPDGHTILFAMPEPSVGGRWEPLSRVAIFRCLVTAANLIQNPDNDSDVQSQGRANRTPALLWGQRESDRSKHGDALQKVLLSALMFFVIVGNAVLFTRR